MARKITIELLKDFMFLEPSIKSLYLSHWLELINCIWNLTFIAKFDFKILTTHSPLINKLYFNYYISVRGFNERVYQFFLTLQQTVGRISNPFKKK